MYSYSCYQGIFNVTQEPFHDGKYGPQMKENVKVRFLYMDTNIYYYGVPTLYQFST